MQAASLPTTPIPGPSAVAAIADANYCFARVRHIEVDRNPPSYLVLELHVKVAYLNPGPRPLIIPTEHERAVYTALKPGVMTVFNEPAVLEPTMVNPADPFSTKNAFFALVPAGGDLISPTMEDIVIPVNHKPLIRHDPDLRGKKLYLRLSLLQQELAPGLEAEISDKWTKVGVPWTGELLTNVMTIDVPQQPQPSGPCTDGAPATRF
jgi:hypothetical protein